MKFIPFDEWMKRNPEFEPEEDCPVCEGHGRHECECGDEHRCGVCNGSGKAGKSLKARAVYKAECERAKAMYQPTPGGASTPAG